MLQLGICNCVFVFVHLYLYLCMCAFVFYWMSIFATCVKLKADPVSVWKVKQCWKQLPRLLGVFQQCRVRLGQDRSVWQFFCLLKTKRMLAAAVASARSFSPPSPKLNRVGSESVKIGKLKKCCKQLWLRLGVFTSKLQASHQQCRIGVCQYRSVCQKMFAWQIMFAVWKVKQVAGNCVCSEIFTSKSDLVKIRAKVFCCLKSLKTSSCVWNYSIVSEWEHSPLVKSKKRFAVKGDYQD